MPFRLQFLNFQVIYLTCVSLSFTETAYAFSEVVKLCETENLNFAVYFTIDNHSYEQVHLKDEPKSFLYEFLNTVQYLDRIMDGQKLALLVCQLPLTVNSNYHEDPCLDTKSNTVGEKFEWHNFEVNTLP